MLCFQFTAKYSQHFDVLFSKIFHTYISTACMYRCGKRHTRADGVCTTVCAGLCVYVRACACSFV